MSQRVENKTLSESDWAVQVANKLNELYPEGELTCAAGISPSGPIHFGNFREIATAHMVQKELQKLGREARLLMSFDDFDRFRKVPKWLDESYKEHLGKPLSGIPDPTGEQDSYAALFEQQFVDAVEKLGIKVDFKYQTQMYKSGVYDEYIKTAMQRRDEIADILLANMTDIAIEQKEIDTEEYKKNYYPISIYSTFTGKDATEILDYDGEMTVTYRCKITDQTETVNLSETRIAKLSWKADWAMRWKHEGVRFEPGGADHATPGSSYTVSSVVTDKIFDYQAPLFVAYGMVGIQGQGGKMSGSKGNAITPGELLEFYDPQLLLWLYERKTPNQHFQLAFDSEVFRQYDEYDKEFFGEKEILSFRQTVGLGQIVQFNKEKFVQLLDALESGVERDIAVSRLPLAQNWLEKYNQEELISVRDEFNDEYFDSLTEPRQRQLQRLAEELSNIDTPTIARLEELSYAIPKEQGYSEDELKKEQRVFFKDVYNMLISADRGPRLGTFLWALDIDIIQKLLLRK